MSSSSSVVYATISASRGAFMQDWPLQYLQMVEHLIPAFLQLQPPLHPNAHLQDIVFRRVSGAGPLRVVTGSRPWSDFFQPQCKGSIGFPLHIWTCKYVLRECWSAASFVGGRDASWKLFLTNILLKSSKRKLSSETSLLFPLYSETRNVKPASLIFWSLALGFWNTCTTFPSSSLWISVFTNFNLPCLKKENVVSHPLKACRIKMLSLTYWGYLKLLESNNLFPVLPFPVFKK